MLMRAVTSHGKKGDALAQYFYANVPDHIQSKMLSLLKLKYSPPGEAQSVVKGEYTPQELKTTSSEATPQKVQPKRTRVEAAILLMENLRKQAAQADPEFDKMMVYLKGTDKFLNDTATDTKIAEKLSALGWGYTDAATKVRNARGGPQAVMGLIRSGAPQSMIERRLNDLCADLKGAKPYLETLTGEGKLPGETDVTGNLLKAIEFSKRSWVRNWPNVSMSC